MEGGRGEIEEGRREEGGGRREERGRTERQWTGRRDLSLSLSRGQIYTYKYIYILQNKMNCLHKQYTHSSIVTKADNCTHPHPHPHVYEQ